VTANKLFKPGDFLTLGMVAISIAWLCVALWRHGAGDTLVVRSKGNVVSELSLLRNRTLTIDGPLGTTVVEVQNQRARIARDPSPKQYCVRQGWLQHAGEIALCLPNQVSIEIAASQNRVDSLNY
jgi:hypothetical protein